MKRRDGESDRGFRTASVWDAFTISNQFLALPLPEGGTLRDAFDGPEGSACMAELLAGAMGYDAAEGFADDAVERDSGELLADALAGLEAAASALAALPSRWCRVWIRQREDQHFRTLSEAMEHLSVAKTFVEEASEFHSRREHSNAAKDRAGAWSRRTGPMGRFAWTARHVLAVAVPTMSPALRARRVTDFVLAPERIAFFSTGATERALRVGNRVARAVDDFKRAGPLSRLKPDDAFGSVLAMAVELKAAHREWLEAVPPEHRASIEREIAWHAESLRRVAPINPEPAHDAPRHSNGGGRP